MADDERDDPDRAAILARRRRFLAVALSGAASTLAGCDAAPMPCLDPVIDAGTIARDAGADAGTSEDAGTSTDAGPMPCLSPPIDAGSMRDAGSVTSDGGQDGGPPAEDAGTSADASPMPCLTPVP